MNTVTVRSLQSQVDQHIRSVGGYWEPLAGIARLLEELAELAEAIAQADAAGATTKSELADLFIIATALSNQYCANLNREFQSLGWPTQISAIRDRAVPGNSVESLFLLIVERSGMVARIVNHYEGQKPKKSNEIHTSLARAVAQLQTSILDMSQASGFDLFQEIEAKLESALHRDQNRFVSSHDPTTEPSLTNFRVLADRTPCPYAGRARVWGARPWDVALSFEENVSRNIPSLQRFTRCSVAEELDGFVFEIRTSISDTTLQEVCRATRLLLSSLSHADPSGEACMDRDIVSPDWQFSFNSQRLFVSVFAACYDVNHPRHSPIPGSIFVFMQPEDSFDHHGIHSMNPAIENIKENIRKIFSENGAPYDAELVRQRIEAYLYVMPMEIGDPPLRWWEVPTLCEG